MNFHDSERIAGLLERDGYELAAGVDEADLVVVNTCSVRERAEEKLDAALGDLKRRALSSDNHVTIAVTGCVAQQEGARILERAPFVDVVVGTQGLQRLAPLVAEAEARRAAQPATARDRSAGLVDINPHDAVSFPLGVTRRADPVRAWVTIIEGC